MKQQLTEIVGDKVILLNTSSIVISMTQLDLILKITMYSISIAYTIYMFYQRVRKDRKGDVSSNNQE